MFAQFTTAASGNAHPVHVPAHGPLRKSRVLLLPCSIEANCEAPVKAYMGNIDNTRVAFRGRELRLENFPLPDFTTGCVVVLATSHNNDADVANVSRRDADTQGSDPEERKYAVSSLFSRVSVLNCGSVNDRMWLRSSIASWMTLSQALHCDPVADQR